MMTKDSILKLVRAHPKNLERKNSEKNNIEKCFIWIKLIWKILWKCWSKSNNITQILNMNMMSHSDNFIWIINWELKKNRCQLLLLFKWQHSNYNKWHKKQLSIALRLFKNLNGYFVLNEWLFDLYFVYCNLLVIMYNKN
jgi:hypothetical protein